MVIGTIRSTREPPPIDRLIYGQVLSVGFTRYDELEVRDLREQVFPAIVGVSFVGVNRGTWGHVKLQGFEGGKINRGPRSEHELHRLARGGNQEMHAQAKEVAVFTGDIASIRFAAIEAAPADADVVALGDGQTIHDVFAARIGLQGHSA